MFRFRLLNLRTDMRLAFVRNGFEFPLVAAWADPITVENVNEPLQGHLALTGKNRCFHSHASLIVQSHALAGSAHILLTARLSETTATLPSSPFANRAVM